MTMGKLNVSMDDGLREELFRLGSPSVHIFAQIIAQIVLF
jgi:hypothetical protein